MKQSTIFESGFTLTELMVSLLIGAALSVGILTFVGRVSYDFAGQRTTLTDRTSLRRTMMILSREFLQIGYKADDKGRIEIDADGNQDYFINLADDGSFTQISYWRVVDDFDRLASQDPDIELEWEEVRYVVETKANPVSEGMTNVLMKQVYTSSGDFVSADPVLFGITTFRIELEQDDGTYSDDYPTNDTQRSAIYAKLASIRVNLGSEVELQAADAKETNETVEQRTISVVYLRNRGEYVNE